MNGSLGNTATTVAATGLLGGSGSIAGTLIADGTRHPLPKRSRRLCRMGHEAGFNDDPDKDGLDNGIEFVVDGNPLSGTPSGLPPVHLAWRSRICCGRRSRHRHGEQADELADGAGDGGRAAPDDGGGAVAVVSLADELDGGAAEPSG